MIILYALLVLLAAVFVTTITSLYDLTISLFNNNVALLHVCNHAVLLHV